jgi:hypothetical protein
MTRLENGLTGFLPKSECDTIETEGPDCPTAFEYIVVDQKLQARILRVQRAR